MMREDGSDAASPAPAASYDGIATSELARRLGVPRLAAFAVVESTMDVAHALAAADAPEGTTVLADRQAAGRGRQGRPWHSASGQGVWLTVVHRPRDPAAIDVLSLRIGLALAEAVDALAPSAVRLKWPNDLYTGSGKLAGILVEARWRDARPEWVAIGVGVNVRPPGTLAAGALRPEVSRVEVLERIVPAIRGACATGGHLTAAEVARFHARDLAVARRVVAPVPGVVRGIDASGAIVISTPVGEQHCRAGSLQFAEDV